MRVRNVVVGIGLSLALTGVGSGVSGTDEAEEVIPSVSDADEASRLVAEYLDLPAEDGAFPVAEPWLTEQAEARAFLGLKTDSGLVEELLTTPRAELQASEYGAVLTPAEEAEFSNVHDQTSQSINLKSQLAELPGWAGSSIEWKSERSMARLVVRVRADSARRAAQIVEDFSNKEQPTFEIVLEEVRYGWSELDDIRDSINAQLEGKGDPESLSETTRETFVRFRDLGVVWAGISIEHNRLVGYLPLDKAVPLPILAEPSVHDSEFVPLEIDQPDTGPWPCEQVGCHTSRAGLQIRDATGFCTLGFAVVDGTDEDWITAEHCHDGSRWDGYFTRDSGSYPAFFAHTRRLDIGPGQNSNTTNGSRSEQIEIGETDVLVTNRMINSFNRGELILGQISPAVLSIGERICISGRTSGYNCGEINDVSDVSNFGGVLYDDQIRAEYVAVGGDSGAPIVMQFQRWRAVSTHSGGATGNESSSPVAFLGDMDPGTVLYTGTNRRKDWILSLYIQGFGRLPQTWEVNHWLNHLSPCNLQNAQSAARDGFFLHPNFRNKYPLTNLDAREARVEKLYNVLPGRRSDTAGFNAWVGFVTTEARWTEAVNGFLNAQGFTGRITGNANAIDGRIC